MRCAVLDRQKTGGALLSAVRLFWRETQADRQVQTFYRKKLQGGYVSFTPLCKRSPFTGRDNFLLGNRSSTERMLLKKQNFFRNVRIKTRSLNVCIWMSGDVLEEELPQTYVLVR
jgi:hypothetical protein